MTNIAETRASFTSEGAYVPDALIAGDFAIHGRKVTLISGQNLARGALLGKITASGKYTLSLAASSDGSEVPNAILAEDVNAAAGDADAMIYTSGDFNELRIIYGTGHTAASTREGLRDLSIFLSKPVSA